MLRDGRRVAYAEWGRPDGRPIVLFHGMPGSRLSCPDEVATDNAGVRLLIVDRPGYGMSSPNPGRTMLDCAADFVEWTDLIGLPPCPVVGWSGGGPYALNCAAHSPDRVTSVGLAASSAPVDEVPGEWESLPDEVRDLMARVRNGAPGAMDGIRERCQWFATGWETIFEPGWGTADDLLLAESGVFEPALAEMHEAARQGTTGYVEDWLADAMPWGFSLSDVPQRVHVWWGDDDQTVRRECAEYLAGAIKHSTLTVLEGEGHMFPIRHWAEILAALL